MPETCSFGGQLIHGAMRLDIVDSREPVAYPDDLGTEIIYLLRWVYFSTCLDRLRTLAIWDI